MMLIHSYRLSYRFPNRFSRILQNTNPIHRVYPQLFSAAADITEGADIIVNEGNMPGRIVQKQKGGWFTCIVNDIDGSEKTIKLRSTKFRLASSTSTSSEPAINQKNIKPIPITKETKPVVSESYQLPYLIPPDRHIHTKNWIIFSDLHVKGTSIDTCEHVLAEVNRAAKARDAGILFLGDFWHVRGALSVELLNRVLKVLRSWTQPVIMIPGNHDQVTLGGSIHSLEPLMYAFPPEQAILISEPAICLGALWIPYRRDAMVMKSILAAGSNHPDVNVIFCHADVKGAFMNDNMLCREGIEVSNFPTNIPIFSGHFHKPHTMKQGESQLRYVGSPYQTSLSEAGQIKYLYNIAASRPSNDSNPASSSSFSQYTRIWHEEERWPIVFGRKFYKAKAVDDDATISAAVAGDRIVIPVRIGEDSSADLLLQQLQSRGIEVEFRYESSPRFRMKQASKLPPEEVELNNTNTIANKSTDDMNPMNIYDTFMKTNRSNMMESVSTSAESWYDEVHKEGKTTLEQLTGQVNAGYDSQHQTKELHIDCVRLRDFGPYGGEAITYPLAQRGLVLLRGKSSDGTGADSNGSGKTTLAMSVMWGLTGSMDTRLVADANAIDVAFDTGSSSDNRTAEVLVSGSINHQPFTVTRRRGKKSALLFIVDGKDLTKQSLKDTQSTIDEMLGIGNSLLQRCCFFGQHSHAMTSLLGLSDRSWKNELGSSSLVDVRLWHAAWTEVRLQARQIKAKVSDMIVEARVRLEEYNRNHLAYQQTIKALDSAQQQFLSANLSASASPSCNSSSQGMEMRNATEIQAELELTSQAIVLLQRQIQPLRGEVLALTKQKAASLSEIDKRISTAREQLVRCRTDLSASTTAHQALQSKLNQFRPQHNQQLATLKQNLSALMEKEVPINPPHLFASLQINLPSITISEDVISTIIPVDAYQQIMESYVSGLAAVDVRILATNTSLKRLAEHQQHHDHHNNSSLQEHEACPTCGQNLSLDLQQQRAAELNATMKALLIEQQSYKLRLESMRKKLSLCQRIRSSQDQLHSSSTRQRELQQEILSYQDQLKPKQDELVKHEQAVAAMMVLRSSSVLEWEVKEANKAMELQAQEEKLIESQDMEKKLRVQLEQIRIIEQQQLISRNQQESSLSLLRDRVTSIQNTSSQQQLVLNSLQQKMDEIEQQRVSLSHNMMVLERLDDIFGPRGIQHFVFMQTIRQLENIANNYLLVLAEGGIQVTLQSNDDDDKIMKTVYIRSAADGEYRERALSQLSGGQWRRVSLSLDFAFTELIRRRGILRCSMMVLDEILTYLDASGREAVGTVLRAMASTSASNKKEQGLGLLPISPSSSLSSPSTVIEYSEDAGINQFNAVASSDNRKVLDGDISSLLVGNGTYETVIVILQDLVAMELEESFDHVDVVVKSADVATVVLDGEF